MFHVEVPFSLEQEPVATLRLWTEGFTVQEEASQIESVTSLNVEPRLFWINQYNGAGSCNALKCWLSNLYMKLNSAEDRISIGYQNDTSRIYCKKNPETK